MTQRRAQILGFDAREGWSGWEVIHVNMPASEMQDLILEVRSISQGVGTFTSAFSHYQELVGRDADRVALVEVSFPTFRDGRGYSAARILRESGYAGELRAAGDVLVDQIPFMRRCGFDSFAPEAPVDPAALDRALNRYAHHYQAAADAVVPVWKLRHG